MDRIEIAFKSGVSVSSSFVRYIPGKLHSRAKLENSKAVFVVRSEVFDGVPGDSINGTKKNLSNAIKRNAGIKMIRKCVFQLDALKSKYKPTIIPKMIL